MARQTFFSFHYQEDIWRVNQVRKSGLTRAGMNFGTEWFDHSLWEKAKSTGQTAVENLIEGGLKGASVTVVLIGQETYLRPWVRYEIERSWELKMGILGLYIDRLENQQGQTSYRGQNPFSYAFGKTANGGSAPLSSVAPCYDYVTGDGYNNLGSWIEDAAKEAGR